MRIAYVSKTGIPSYAKYDPSIEYDDELWAYPISTNALKLPRNNLYSISMRTRMEPTCLSEFAKKY